MTIDLKPLSEQCIVVLGASSGIGLATAKLAAKRGAKVFLAARSEDALAQAVREIREAGGAAEYGVADVALKAQVQAIGERAVATYGRIDTWVNVSGLGLYARLEEPSEEDNRRLFDTSADDRTEDGMNQTMMEELLLQSLEHELGGVKIYEAAVSAASNERLAEV